MAARADVSAGTFSLEIDGPATADRVVPAAVERYTDTKVGKPSGLR